MASETDSTHRRDGVHRARFVRFALATTLAIGAIHFGAISYAQAPDADAHWAQWRGPQATGVAPNAHPPSEWSETQNVRWKVEVPGVGHATPIVWGDRVYLLGAVKTDREAGAAEIEKLKKARPERPRRPRAGRNRRGGPQGPGDRGGPPGHGGPGGPGGRRPRGGHGMGGSTPTNIHEFVVLALDRKDGKIVWQRKVCEALPHEGGHQDSTQASNSPVTDGEHIIAHFGSRGLFALNMEGEVIWSQQLGKMQTRNSFGEGSSPALHKDSVVVNWDHEGQSFVAAFDKNTGEQRWKVDRDEPTSWATPIVVEAAGKPQVVTSATNFIRSYDLDTGSLLWQCGGMTLNTIPSPVVGNDLLYATSGFRGQALQAIRYADAKGDITDSATVAWKYDGKGTPYVPSPLLYDDALYFLSSNKAILSCVDAKTGKANYTKKRLEGLSGVYASPVGADGRVYVVGRNGTTAVIKHGREFELLGMNELDEEFSASPTIAGNELYLRGKKHLYCIAGS